MARSRDKGARGERELAAKLSEVFGVPCERTQQFCGKAGDADVRGVSGIHAECKRVERFELWRAVDQAVSDAADGNVPVVFHRPSRRPWLAIVRVDDLPALVKALAELK